MSTILSAQSNRGKFAFAVAVAAMFAIVFAIASATRTNAAFTVGTTPVVGATVTFARTNGASTQTTTDQHGNFTASIANAGAYTFSVSPLTVYNNQGRPVPGPFQFWATFNQCKGLTVSGFNATSGPTGPIAFKSDSTLRVSLSFAGSVSGVITR